MRNDDPITAATSHLPTLLTVGEAASALRCCKRTIWYRISDGSLTAIRLPPLNSSGAVRIPRTSVQSMLRRGLGRAR